MILWNVYKRNFRRRKETIFPISCLIFAAACGTDEGFSV